MAGLMRAAGRRVMAIPEIESFVSGIGRGEVQSPLGAVVIGGLATSMILTLLVAPAMYRWFSLRSDQVTLRPNKLG